MDNVLIGQKDKYDWTWDLIGPFAYIPRKDAVLATRYFILSGTPEEYVAENTMVALCHESIHEALYKLVGEKESRAFDDVPHFNKEIEEWLGLHFELKKGLLG